MMMEKEMTTEALEKKLVETAEEAGARFKVRRLPNGNYTVEVFGRKVSGGGCYKTYVAAAVAYLCAASRNS